MSISKLNKNGWVLPFLCFLVPVRTMKKITVANDHPVASQTPYLIFVHSINSSASVKKLTEGNFFSQLTRKGLLTVYFCTQCVISHTICHFTHSV